MEFTVTQQQLLSQANELKKLYESTREQKYKDQENRLRRIVVELSQFSSGSQNLDGLTDVTISAPANAQVLTYNSTNGQWENQTPTGGVTQIVAGANVTISPTGGTGVVTVNASNVITEPTGYGSFYSNVTQTLSAINTPQAVTLGSTYEANGTSTSGSKIYLDKAGTYQFSYVAQVASNSSGQETAEFWIKYNGVVYPNSNTKMVLQPRKSADQPSEQLMTLIINGTSLNDNDYIELFWEATSTQVSLKYEPANASYPAAPSIIANIIPIGAPGREPSLNELSNVATTSPANGDLLRYDSASGLWENFSGFTGTITINQPIPNPPVTINVENGLIVNAST